MAAAKLMKLELIYSSRGKKLMLPMLFFAVALAAMSVLYTVYDAEPCAFLSDCPDDFIVDFYRPRWPLTRTISLLSAGDQAQPNQFETVSDAGGLGIESHPQIKVSARKTWREKVGFYSAIFRDLAARGLLRPGFKALSVGASSSISVVALRENGVLNATGVDDRRSAGPMKADNQLLPFADKSFDFIFAGSFDRATVPALLASEIERTLKAKGVAVMLVSPRRPNNGKPSNPVHSLSPVVALFKCSDVVHVNTSGSPSSHETTVIALRKRTSGGSKAPGSSKPPGGSKALGLIKDHTRSKQNKSLTKLAEPLTKNHSKAIFLPNVKDISDRKPHNFVKIGGNNHSNNNNTSDADAGGFLASYPKQNQTVDTSVLNPRANQSGLGSLPRRSLNSIKQVMGDNGSSRSRERFDIAGWLSEMSTSDEDFVVVKMGFEHVTREIGNKRGARFTLAIDQLFQYCSSEFSEEVDAECLQFLQTLRDNGVFVHRW